MTAQTRFTLTTLVFVLFSTFFALGQCPNNNIPTTNAPTILALSGPQDTVRNSCVSMGQYVLMEVCAGVQYVVYTCETPETFPLFDTYISVYNDANPLDTVVFNDDFCGPIFGYHAYVNWTSDFDGFVRILIDNGACMAPEPGCVVVTATQLTSCCDSVGIVIVDESCAGNDGYIIATGTVNAPWNYTWRNATNQIIKQTIGSFTSDTLTGLSAGTYFVSVVDSSFCTKFYELTVANTGTLNLTLTGLNSVYCQADAPDSVIALPPGGVLSGPGISGNFFDPMQAGVGTHTIKYVFSTPACEDSAFLQVTVTSAFFDTLTISIFPPDICEGDTVSFTANTLFPGPSPTYQWFINGSPVGGNDFNLFAPVIAGDSVSVSYTSSQSCVVPGTITATAPAVTINQSVPFSASLLTIQPGSCPGDTIILTHSPISFSCDFTFITWLVNGTPVSNSDTVILPNLQNGDVVSLNIFIDGCNACLLNNSISDTVNINLQASIDAEVSLTVQPGVCIGDTSHFTATPQNGGPNPTYVWLVNNLPVFGASGSQISVPNLNNGDVVTVIMITSLTNCVGTPADTASYTVSGLAGPQQVSITISGNPNPICAGDAITFSANVTGSTTGTYAVEWYLNGSNTGQTGDTLVGNYNQGDTIVAYLFATEPCGATPVPAISNSIIVTWLPSPVAGATLGGPVCPGEPTPLCANQATSYLWGGGQTTQCIDITQPGTYFLTVTDANGCTDTAIINIANLTFLPAPSPVLQQGGPVCEGEPVPLCSDAFATYAWNTGANTQCIGITSTGVYSITVSDGNGCTGTSSITISSLNQHPAPVPTANQGPAVCFGEPVTLCSEPFAAYLWENGSTTQCIEILSTGLYGLTVTDANGCQGEADIAISDLNQIILSVDASAEPPTIQSGETSTLSTNLTGPYTWSWTPAAFVNDASAATPVATPDESTWFVVTVTDSNGCTATDSVWVEVEIINKYVIPSAFTPNNDGQNDFFEVLTKGEVTVAECMIYNRWGQLIYNNSDAKWDGTFKGANQPAGTYVYMVTLRLGDGTLVKETNAFSLIR